MHYIIICTTKKVLFIIIRDFFLHSTRDEIYFNFYCMSSCDIQKSYGHFSMVPAYCGKSKQWVQFLIISFKLWMMKHMFLISFSVWNRNIFIRSEAESELACLRIFSDRALSPFENLHACIFMSFFVIDAINLVTQIRCTNPKSNYKSYYFIILYNMKYIYLSTNFSSKYKNSFIESLHISQTQK